MHEQPARAKRVLVEDIALLIGRDVHLPDEKLAILDLTPSFLQAERAEADGFDLGPGEFDAGLEFSSMKYSWNAFWFRAAIFTPSAMERTSLRQSYDVYYMSIISAMSSVFRYCVYRTTRFSRYC